RLIGPPTLAFKAQFGVYAGSIADYIANPQKKRPDFPTMPPQDHLSEPMRQLVAEYMLALTN
ncbi:MAG: cytochrome-c peroxidase, partial [Halieaceae bacterium]